MTGQLKTDPDNQYSSALAMVPGKMEMCKKRMEDLTEHTAHVSDVLRAMEDEEQQNTNHQRQPGRFRPRIKSPRRQGPAYSPADVMR